MNTLIRNDMDTYDHLQHSIILQNPLLSDEVGTINHETRSRKPDGSPHETLHYGTGRIFILRGRIH